MKQHFEDIQELLNRCKDNQITLNKKKRVLGKQKVKFAGYMVEIVGIELESERLKR